MQWWTDFLDWFNSADARDLATSVLLPFLAIVVAGISGALIGRGSTKRIVALHEREGKAAAVTALVAAGRRAAVWSTLTAEEKLHADHLASEAETRVRLLPVASAALAGDWSAHQLADMRRHSASYSYQAEQTLIEFRDGLLAWQKRPGRARKLFAQDLAAWKYDDENLDRDLAAKQQQWASRQVADPVDTDSTKVIQTEKA